MNVNDLYLLNTQAVMVFLYKLNLANAFDFEILNDYVERMADKNFEYRKKLSMDFCYKGPDIDIEL